MRTTPIRVNIKRESRRPEGARPRFEYPFQHAWRECGSLEWIPATDVRMHRYAPEVPDVGMRYWMTIYRIPLPDITPETTGSIHCVEITAGSVDVEGTVHHLGSSVQVRTILVPEPDMGLGLLVGIGLLIGLWAWRHSRNSATVLH